MKNEQETLNNLLRKVRNKRRRIASFVGALEPRGVRLVNLSIICGAIATLLTAGPAIGGSRLTDALGSAGPNSPSWRILCGGAMFFSFLATIATNLYKSHDMASRLAKAQACDAKLEALETLVELGQMSVKDAAGRYEECIPEVSFIPSDREARRWSRNQPSLDMVKGEIKEPSPNQVVEDTFLCAGWANGLKSGLHLWLFVEIDGRIWPKEGEVYIEDDGSWNKTVFEEGAIGHFSLSLFAVNADGDTHVRDWFKACDRTGSYPELRRTPGMIRLARVNGLRSVQVNVSPQIRFTSESSS